MEAFNTRADAPAFPVVSMRPGPGRIWLRVRHRMSGLSSGQALRLGLDIAETLNRAGVPAPSHEALEVQMLLQLEVPGGTWEVRDHGAIAVEMPDTRLWLRFADGECIAMSRREAWGVVASLSRLLDYTGTMLPAPQKKAWLN